MITLYRITTRRHGKTAGDAFSGEGARLYPGRWNSGGLPVVYTADTLSLAMLEILAHIDEAMLAASYVYFTLSIPEDAFQTVPKESLAQGWDRYPAPLATRTHGDAWLASGETLALKVPSVLNPIEHTFLVNPTHPKFSQCPIQGPFSFSFDARLK